MSSIKNKVSKLLKKQEIDYISEEVKNKTNRITTEAEIKAQTEKIKQALDRREKTLEKRQKASRDIKQEKDNTRQKLYKTLLENQLEDSFKK